MNILFLCGSLEPGQDGVGDYSRRLAGEVKRQGHKSTIIALNDGYASNVVELCQYDEMEAISVLRLPKLFTWKKRFSIIDQWIRANNPDWISLQFVPFAFQDKGLPFTLAYRLKRITGNIKWHIMFHELWVGKENVKLGILARLQKHLVESLLKRISASVVHTHLPLYHEDLRLLGITTRKLPLFSNFSMSPNLQEDSHVVFRVGFFNQVASYEKIFNFLLSLHQESLKRNLKFEILLIGGGRSIKDFGEKLEAIIEFRNKVFYTGFLRNQDVTSELAKCNIGMTPLPYSILGKSGTSAAFLAQGIPIAVPIDDGRRSPFFDIQLLDALITKPNFDTITKATIAAKKWKGALSLSRIAELFLNDLTNDKKHD
jgi:hypothetical protein